MFNTGSKSLIVILGLLCVGLIYLLAPILTPFLAGAILAYLGDPLVNLFMRLRLPRLMSVILVFIILFLVFIVMVLIIVPILEKQIATLAVFIPATFNWIQKEIIPWITTHFGLQESINVDSLKTTLSENWTKAGSILTWLLKTILHSGFALIALVTNLILIPVVTFYLLRDWNEIVVAVRNLLPRNIEPTVVKLARECDIVLSAFFRGQLLVMLALGVIYSIGLSMIGLQIGVMIGMMAGLVSIVPYLGFIVGIVAASVAAFVQFGTWTSLIGVIIVFLIGQAMESMVLTPQLVGDRIGLHPVAVIFAILAGGTLFGFFGVLLALPTAAVIMVWLRYLNQRYRESGFYKIS